MAKWILNLKNIFELLIYVDSKYIIMVQEWNGGMHNVSSV